MIARREALGASARWAALLAALIALAIPTAAGGSALGSLRNGETVEVTGTWDPGTGLFVASRLVAELEGELVLLPRAAGTRAELRLPRH